jgi:hypothetical protein
MTEYNKTWKTIGAVTLYTLIGFGAAALLTFAYSGMWYWFAAISGCFASVIIAEIVSFIVFKKSISKQYGEWIKRSPVPAYLGLVFFSAAMISLVLHLCAYGLR